MADETERCPARVLRSLRPEIVLVNFGVSRPTYEHLGDGRLVDEIGLDRTAGNPSLEEVARLEAGQEALRVAWAKDPDFVCAVERLEGVGIDWVFACQSDACGVFSVLQLRIAIADLGRLEALAAENSGYATPEERALAAERFRVFMLRNYHPDWKRNRELYPDVGGSPYADPATWPKST